MDIDLLKKHIAYNPDTGEFTRLTRTVGGQGIRGIGAPVGSMNDRGYLVTHAQGKLIRLHRLAVAYMTGEMPSEDMHVDHINGNRTDNRWTNLRVCTQQQNAVNMKLRADNSSGVSGVSYCKTQKKWTVKVRSKGVTHSFGSYDSLEQAKQVRLCAQNSFDPEFRRA